MVPKAEEACRQTPSPFGRPNMQHAQEGDHGMMHYGEETCSKLKQSDGAPPRWSNTAGTMNLPGKNTPPLAAQTAHPCGLCARVPRPG